MHVFDRRGASVAARERHSGSILGVRVFLAEATGMIGMRLVWLLVAGDHRVAGMTRSPEKANKLRALGAEPFADPTFGPSGEYPIGERMLIKTQGAGREPRELGPVDAVLLSRPQSLSGRVDRSVQTFRGPRPV